MCRNFDPWGVRLNGTGTVNAFQNRWELQGKEKEMTFNLNRVNFGARVYNPTIGRWDRSDPMAEKYYPYSTFNYTLNNPINSIDPDGNEVFDWIKNKETNQYVWDSNVTSAANTPENFEYVGRSVSDVQKDFEKNNPVASFFGMKPSFGENRTSYPGEIAQNTPNWIDNWASSDNLLASASYSLANSFSVTLQSLNPFDNQITSLTGEDLGGADRSGYGAEAISSLIPSGSAKYAAGPLKQWVRLGPSYSHNLASKTTRSLRWGASPKYLKEIPSSTFRTLNQQLRGLKLPGNSWRVKDFGHLHINK